MSDLCNEIEKFGKGIGNVSRYHILEALAKGPKTVTELVKIAKLSQPSISQHLKTLKACDLVTDKRHGREVLYAVNAEYTLVLLKKLTAEMQNKKSNK
jgi:DNA-binding transcriptional ArsR family regulator